METIRRTIVGVRTLRYLVHGHSAGGGVLSRLQRSASAATKHFAEPELLKALN